MDIQQFDYQLPSKYIAQKPIHPRNCARMMVLDRASGQIRHDRFYNLGSYLRPGDCLVVNQSKVLRCRLKGKKADTQAKIECFVLKKVQNNCYLALLKPFKRLKEGSRVRIGDQMMCVEQKKDRGKALVTFSGNPQALFRQYGLIPLPPYIQSKHIEETDYQTVYADREGSVAAPTAGLHFTDDQIQSLKQEGIVFAKITLNIGMDTFMPIREKEIEKHNMHSEYYQIEQGEAHTIRQARKAGARIIAVGTTSVRVLETVMEKHGAICADQGETSLYIYPGYTFRAVEAIITNFHLPRSTLLVMISAFTGRKKLLSAYKEAKHKNYRFYSFGDCMLIM